MHCHSVSVRIQPGKQKSLWCLKGSKFNAESDVQVLGRLESRQCSETRQRLATAGSYWCSLVGGQREEVVLLVRDYCS